MYVHALWALIGWQTSPFFSLGCVLSLPSFVGVYRIQVVIQSEFVRDLGVERRKEAAKKKCQQTESDKSLGGGQKDAATESVT